MRIVKRSQHSLWRVFWKNTFYILRKCQLHWLLTHPPSHRLETGLARIFSLNLVLLDFVGIVFLSLLWSVLCSYLWYSSKVGSLEILPVCLDSSRCDRAGVFFCSKISVAKNDSCNDGRQENDGDEDGDDFHCCWDSAGWCGWAWTGLRGTKWSILSHPSSYSILCSFRISSFQVRTEVHRWVSYMGATW